MNENNVIKNNRISGKENVKTKGTGCLGFTMIGIPLIIIILILGIWMYRSYNGMVEREEQVNMQWANVENVYQLRADLIMNLYESVVGYAQHEKSTLTDVVEARAKASSLNINADHLDPQSLEQFQAVQSEMSSALSRLLVVIEKYPDLKAIESFTKLMNDNKEIENRINVERDLFNAVAKEYNQYIRKFPKNIFASWFGFETKGYFKAEEGTEKAPQYKFSDKNNNND
ncbi:MAG: LemA family protein [Marinilabiliales bacterium]